MHTPGYNVTLFRNATDIDIDIDDNVVALASEREPWWARAHRIEREFTRLYAAMGILPPAYEPRTSGHIPQSQFLIKPLIDRGHAHVATDGFSGVYFGIGSCRDYGAFTQQEPNSVVGIDESPNIAKRDA